MKHAKNKWNEKEKLYFNLVDKQSFKYISLNVASIETSFFLHIRAQPGKWEENCAKFHISCLNSQSKRVLWKEMWMKRENSRSFIFCSSSPFLKECMLLLFACIDIANDVFGIVFHLRGLETYSYMNVMLCGMEFLGNILVSMFLFLMKIFLV